MHKPGDPGRHHGCHHGGRGIGREARRACERHHDNECDGAHDIGRQQREVDPPVGARNAFLRVAEREHRHRHAGEIERHDLVTADPRFEQPDAERTETCDQRRDRQRHPSAAGQEAAQQRKGAQAGIFRDEALRRRRQAEIDQRTDQQHPGPDIDVDAEFMLAHPARQEYLDEIDERRARDPDQECGAGHALRQRAVAAVGEPRASARMERARPWACQRGFIGTSCRHVFPPARTCPPTPWPQRP